MSNRDITQQQQVQLWEQMSSFESNARAKGKSCIAGIDEAGRGPLAGPVVACACVLPEDLVLLGLKDSKLLSARQRGIIYEQLVSNPKVMYSVAEVSPDCIDRMNILEATKEAMRLSVQGLPCDPDYVLVDAVALDLGNRDVKSIIKGDRLSVSIAAASIIAKEYRDRIMLNLHDRYPEYGFASHKGYGTKQHLEALRRYGVSPVHRKTFSPIKQYLYESTC